MNSWAAAKAETGSNSYQNTFKKSFGPRVGLAYQVAPGTLVRAGYGIYYQNSEDWRLGEKRLPGLSLGVTTTPAL